MHIACVYTYIYMHVYMYMYIHIYQCTYINIYVYTYVYINIFIYIHIHIHIHIQTHMRIHIHTHIEQRKQAEERQPKKKRNGTYVTEEALAVQQERLLTPGPSFSETPTGTSRPPPLHSPLPTQHPV